MKRFALKAFAVAAAGGLVGGLLAVQGAGAQSTPAQITGTLAVNGAPTANVTSATISASCLNVLGVAVGQTYTVSVVFSPVADKASNSVPIVGLQATTNCKFSVQIAGPAVGGAADRLNPQLTIGGVNRGLVPSAGNSGALATYTLPSTAVNGVTPDGSLAVAIGTSAVLTLTFPQITVVKQVGVSATQADEVRRRGRCIRCRGIVRRRVSVRSL